MPKVSRIARPITALAAAALSLTGCGMAQEGGALAIVDGRTITAQQAQDAIDALEPVMQGKIETGQIVNVLIMAPAVVERAESTGHWVPDTNYTNIMSGFVNPSPDVDNIVKFLLITRDNVLTPDDIEAVRHRLQQADVRLNPRFGTFSVDAPPALGIRPVQPNWIVPTPTATASR